MNRVESARQIDEEAADWAVRREEHESDPVFAAALEAWLAADPRRQGALLRAEAALSYLNRGRALGRVDTETSRPHRITRRGLIVGGGALAAMAAGVAGLAFLLSQPESYHTAFGEVRKVPLADGSLSAINTDTNIQVAMTSDLRRLILTKGEAWFNVAKDPKRPFLVEAGDVRVRALGTAFSVRRRDNGADVLVTEGVVETWAVGDENRRARLSAGARAFVVQGQTISAVRSEPEVINALAWRDGQIALYGETLGEAAAQFNRYNARKIVITDPALAGEKVVGQFSAYEPEAFVRAAANTLGARVVDEGPFLRLYPGTQQ